MIHFLSTPCLSLISFLTLNCHHCMQGNFIHAKFLDNHVNLLHCVCVYAIIINKGKIQCDNIKIAPVFNVQYTLLCTTTTTRMPKLIIFIAVLDQFKYI